MPSVRQAVEWIWWGWGGGDSFQSDILFFPPNCKCLFYPSFLELFFLNYIRSQLGRYLPSHENGRFTEGKQLFKDIYIYIYQHLLEIKTIIAGGAREFAQWLRTLTTLPEVLGPIPSAHMTGFRDPHLQFEGIWFLLLAHLGTACM